MRQLYTTRFNRVARTQRFSKPSAIFFDWDGTIIKLDKARFFHSFNKTLAMLNAPESMEESIKTIYASTSVMNSFEKRFSSQERVLDALSLFEQHFVSHILTETDYMPAAKEVIMQINSLKIPTAIISNLETNMLEKQVSMLGLTNSFSVIRGCANKPNHDALIKTANDLSLAVNKSIWFIGDSQTDVLASHYAGFTSVLVNSELEIRDIKSDITLENLAELMLILDANDKERAIDIVIKSLHLG